MADSTAEIETQIRVHFFHGYPSNLTIKDNPDVPEFGFEIHYEENGLNSSICGLFKEDLDKIIEALQKYKDNQ